MSNLQFDFSVDKKEKTITVKRAFAAPLAQVWAAWTSSELLNKWWAPKPYYVKTKSMDFTVGGFWLYAMVSPEGEEHWCRADYKSIDKFKGYVAADAFCDEDGKVKADFPQSVWTNSFSADGENTLVTIIINHEKLEDLEKTLEMGFKEGFAMGLGNLDELLATHANK